ncbi:hypothetical protein F7725_019787 [Dissostichus mawsoni]|uniref:Uncharacterized protein n=1 Tax=Dissostichus mawsoni TaxID=36200 RepID=A0A7J5YP67_DISMA|nr:hypothetical protein F7725_019787 [Dissostichus mawsoni]
MKQGFAMTHAAAPHGCSIVSLSDEGSPSSHFNHSTSASADMQAVHLHLVVLQLCGHLQGPLVQGLGGAVGAGVHIVCALAARCHVPIPVGLARPRAALWAGDGSYPHRVHALLRVKVSPLLEAAVERAEADLRRPDGEPGLGCGSCGRSGPLRSAVHRPISSSSSGPMCCHVDCLRRRRLGMKRAAAALPCIPPLHEEGVVSGGGCCAAGRPVAFVFRAPPAEAGVGAGACPQRGGELSEVLLGEASPLTH